MRNSTNGRKVNDTDTPKKNSYPGYSENTKQWTNKEKHNGNGAKASHKRGNGTAEKCMKNTCLHRPEGRGNEQPLRPRASGASGLKAPSGGEGSAPTRIPSPRGAPGADPRETLAHGPRGTLRKEDNPGAYPHRARSTDHGTLEGAAHSTKTSHEKCRGRGRGLGTLTL